MYGIQRAVNNNCFNHSNAEVYGSNIINTLDDLSSFLCIVLYFYKT